MGRQAWHLGGDTDVTQTCTNNSLKKTLAVEGSENADANIEQACGSEGLSNEVNKDTFVPDRTAAVSREIDAVQRYAARDAAERTLE